MKLTQKIILSFCLGMIFVIIILGEFQHIYSTKSFATQPLQLTVSAAISLKDALEEIKPIYQKIHQETQIIYNFSSSGSLQQQIEQGAPVDIFISAANKQMDALESKKLLLAGTRQKLLTNQLVLVTPKNEKLINKIQDLTQPNVEKIAMGEPNSVPAGFYSEEVMRYYKILDKINSKLIYAKNVRQVLSYLETGNVNAGFVYLSDAKTSREIRLVEIFSKNSHTPIVYPIAILKSSKNPKIAKEFSQFLFSPFAKKVFNKYGFGT
jgi:molybdate transport system substrate-binding protein